MLYKLEEKRDILCAETAFQIHLLKKKIKRRKGRNYYPKEKNNIFFP